MQRITSAILGLLALMCLPAPAVSVEGNQDAEIPGWFKGSFLDLKEDIDEAGAQGKRLMMYFHQNGCPYCALLINTNFSQKATVEYIDQHFDAIDINLWGDRDVTDLAGNTVSEKKFASNLKVWFTPTLLFFNEQGEVVLRINGYYPPHQFLAALRYVAEKQETRSSFRDYYARVSPAKASGRLRTQDFFLKPPYDLARRKGDKPLAVFFEQKDCPACDTLHADILSQPASRALLARFDVVQLDMWSDTPVVTPAGKATTARQWASDAGIVYAPSVILFDRGREIIRIEAFLKAFHVQSVMDYVASGAYQRQPNLQRYLSERAQALSDKGQKVDIWK